MDDMGEVFREMHEERKARRRNNYKNNLKLFEVEGWSKFTDHHWHMMLDGKRLDFWPASNKYMYAGTMYRGARPRFIQKLIDKALVNEESPNE